MIVTYERIFDRFKERVAIFCLFFSGLSIPGSESIVAAEGVNFYQTIAKAILICSPLILFPSLKYLDTSQIKKNSTLLLLGGYGVLTSIWSPIPVFTAIRAFSFIITILSILMILNSYKMVGKDYCSLLLIDLYFVTGIFILFFAVIGVIHLDLAWRKIYVQNSIIERLGGDILPPNTLGALAGLHFILTFLNLSKKKYMSLFSIILAIYVLIQTNSRGALLALFFSWGIVYVLFSLLTYNLRFIGAAFIALSIFAGYLMLIDDRTIKSNVNYYSRYQNSDEFKTFTGRTYIWKGIFAQDMLTLFAGNGFGVLSERALIKYHTISTINAHNGFLQIVAGTGIGGFSLFLVFLIILFYHIRKAILTVLIETQQKRSFQTMLFLTIFILINNFVESSFGGQIVPQLIVFLFVSGLFFENIGQTES